MIDFKKLKTAYDKLSVYDIQNASCISTEIIENYQGMLKEIPESPFSPHFVIEYLNKCDKVIKIQYKNISLHLFCLESMISMYKIYRTIKQCHIIKQHFNIKKPINIHIIFNPTKRYMPSANEHINCSHINGGFTTTNDNKIFIVREEEFPKVIIHELLHHCPKIHNELWPQHHIDILKRHFNISHNMTLVPNECVVEFWATILYIAFLSYEYNIPMNLLFTTELQHCLKQYNKIIKKQGNEPWYETTNAFCYIVLKCILLYHMKQFNDTKSYDTGYITKFLIQNSSLPIMISRDKTLRMMKLSDY